MKLVYNVKRYNLYKVNYKYMCLSVIITCSVLQHLFYQYSTLSETATQEIWALFIKEKNF